MRIAPLTGITLSFGLLLTGCAGSGTAGPMADSPLLARSGSHVSGSVGLTQMGEKLLIEARVSGLTPGEHGFHVHEAGDCSATDGSSAKGHFNPGSKAHGHHGGHDRHAGDLPNLVADANGNAIYRAEVVGLSLSDGPNSILGRSMVIHADPDDYQSQPAGNSGKRIACGVITPR